MKRLLGFLFVLCLAGAAFAEESPYVELSNDFIKIFVTRTDQEMGRFAVDATKGDPFRPDDDNKPLIYGHPVPWTSYTTVRLDGKNYVFGGPSTKRAGSGGLYGRVIAPPHRDGSELVTIFDLDGVQVEERLALTTNPYSGYDDTARIRYRLVNTTNSSRTAGLRAVLDTMLGSNDGAPFRVGGQNIAAQTVLSQTELPDVWQAFDSLAAPSVIAQGILKGYGATVPDAVVFTDWGTAADNLWELPIDPKRDFTRAGEDEPDTAIALYWSEQPLPPQGSREITLLYGLGGVTMAPGASFLGIAAPAEILYDPKGEHVYQVLTYVENQTARIARNVKVRLNLPPGLALADGPKTVVLERMEPKETRQFLWNIKADGTAFGPAEIELSVTGEDLTANSLRRALRILGPPVLQAAFDRTDLTQWRGGPFRLNALVKNTGGSTARDLWVTLNLSPGLRLAEGESAGKYLIDIAPGEVVPVYWWVLPEKPGNVTAIMNGSHQGGKGELARTALSLPALPGEVSIVTAREVSAGEAFCLEVVCDKLPPFTGFSLDFGYDPYYFKVLRVTKGSFSLAESETSWQPGTNDSVNGAVRGIAAERKEALKNAKFSLVRIFLLPLHPGESLLTVENLKFKWLETGMLPVYNPALQIKIKEVGP